MTHLSLDDLRKTDAGEELVALWEEIVADLDDWIAKGITLDLDAPVRALIAALRERVAELQAETGYTDAIRAVATRAENEACAKVAEDAGPATQDMRSTELCEFGDRIAAAIRARIKP